MPVKKYKPTSPGRRGMIGSDFSTLNKKKPEKSLLKGKKRGSGRGSAGKITTRHRGGGAKKRFRVIDFKMNKFDIPAKVQAIEYDPNRTAFIALLAYADGEKRYIVAQEGLKKNDKIIISKNAPVKIGNRLPLKKIPAGTIICNVELFPGKGSQIARSAGSSAKLMAIESGFAYVSFSSKKVELIPEDSFATIGGRRPQVRGSAMNPVDHPHGGGEGRQPIGLKHPKTPWGKPALGFKTRKKNKPKTRYRIKKRDEE